MSQFELIFVRHGEASNSWGSHNDPGLSTEGKNQAKSILKNEYLQNLDSFDFISSPKLRAIETSTPLAKKYKKKVVIDEIFDEIPSKNIIGIDKRAWLSKIVKMKKSDLPNEVLMWEEKILRNINSFENNSIIFCHFMVINSIVSSITKSNSILFFHPDYVSITKLILKNGQIESFQIGDSKKTYVNI